MKRKNHLNRTVLGFQSLEDRRLLASDSSEFLGLGNFTLSLAPDDTQFGREVSDLNKVFDQKFGSEAWKQAIYDAAKAWVPHANVNFGLVDDDGSAAGVLGPWRGDERFGDVRVFGVQLEDQVWAEALNSNARVSGTWAGDVVFNTTADWTSIDQLRFAALHEFGHVLGLEHSDDPDSVMNPSSELMPLTPSDSDIERLRALHGERLDDIFDQEEPNDRLKRASRLRGSGIDGESNKFDGSQVWLAFGDITRQQDVDYFRVKVDDGSRASMTIGVQTQGYSLANLEARLMTKSGKVLSSVEVDPQSGWATMTVNPRKSNDRIYLAIQGDNQSEANIGSYSVLVASPEVFTDSSEITEDWVNRTYRWHQNADYGEEGYSYREGDLHGGLTREIDLDDDEGVTEFETVLLEPAVITNERIVYAAAEEFIASDETHRFELAIPDEGIANASLQVEIHSLDRYGLVPDLVIQSLDGNALQTSTTSKGLGITQVTISGYAPGERISIEITASSVTEAFRLGRYALRCEIAVDLYDEVVLIESSRSGVGSSPITSFQTNLPQLVKFDVRSVSESIPAKADGAAVVLAVYDNELNLIQAFASPINDIRSFPGVFLPTGKYHVRVSNAYRGNHSLFVDTVVTAEFYGDPIGPLASPMGQDPILDVGEGGDFAIPDLPDEEDPIVLYPTPQAEIPDPIWLDPLNLGDDWYWETFTPVSFGALEGFGSLAPNNGNFQGLSTGTGSDTTFNTNLDGSGTLGNDAALIINADQSDLATSSSAMENLGLVDQALADLTGSIAQLDINGDQRITAADALMVINFLARSQSSTIVDDDATGMDFNGDGRVTALDALRVINRVSRNSVRQ